MINLKLIKDAGFAGKAAPADAGPPGPSRGKAKGGIKGGGKKGLSSLLTSLVSWWDFESDGSDSHGSNNLTEVGTITYPAAKVGNGAYYALSTAEHSKTLASELSGGDRDFSTAGWVNFDVTTGSPVVLSSYISSSTADNSWLVQYTGTVLKMQIASGSTWYTCNASTFGAMSISTWYFFYAYYDAAADQLGISINDGTIDTLGSVPAPNNASHTFTVGGYAGSSFGLAGTVDSVAFWNRLLTSDEVTLLYNSGAGRQYSALP